jgi:anthranilate/para-aminobenzoate synthase component I
VPRGAYTGAFGWLNRDGDLDLNILIRTAEVDGHEVSFRTGAGIVVDSDPDAELDETRAKARGLLRGAVPAAGAIHRASRRGRTRRRCRSVGADRRHGCVARS